MSVSLNQSAELDTLFPVADHKGVAFRVIGPFLRSPQRFQHYDQLAQRINEWCQTNGPVDVLLALDSRGYLIAESIASRLLSVPGVVMAAKPGKLAGETIQVQGTKEYGSTAFELDVTAIHSGQRVLVIDDLVAEGGSAQVARQLIEHPRVSATFCGIVCLIILSDLGAAQRFLPHPIFAMASFAGKRSPADLEKEEQSVHDIHVLEAGAYGDAPLDPSVVPVVIAAFPSLIRQVKHVCAYAPNLFRMQDLHWGKFPDGSDNTEMEDSDQLQSFGKHLLYYGSFRHFDKITEQLSACTAITGQPAKSYTVQFDYLPVTHERVTRSGGHLNQYGLVEFKKQAIATAHTLSKQLCGAVSGRPVLRFFDIHAEAARFYANDKELVPVESSMLPAFLRLVDVEFALPAESNQVNMIATTDDGGYKRFSRYLFGRVTATCAKKREAGDVRKVSLKDVNGLKVGQEVKNIFLIDDMIESLSTMVECALMLRKEYPNASIMAFATHAKCGGDKWKRVLPSGDAYGVFDKIYVSNTIPETVEAIRGIAPFHVIDTAPYLVHEYARQYGLTKELKTLGRFYGNYRIFVASTNVDKINAFRFAFRAHFPYASSIEVFGCETESIPSPVPEQPFGDILTRNGALTRAHSIVLPPTDDVDLAHVQCFVGSIESGAYYKRLSQTRYVDQAVIVLKHLNSDRTVLTHSGTTPIPSTAMLRSQQSEYHITAGKFIAQDNPGVSHSNWHAKFGGYSRVDLLKHAIEELLYQF